MGKVMTPYIASDIDILAARAKALLKRLGAAEAVLKDDQLDAE